MKKILVCLAGGFEEMEAITITDVLRRAELEAVTVSFTGDLRVTGSHGITVLADQLSENTLFDEYAMIILPGGMPGAKNLKENEMLGQKILQFYDQGKSLAAICAAPMVLGELGILSGKSATCYPGYQQYLRGAHFKSQPVVEEGEILTANGPGAAVPFALKIVEKYRGREVAEMIGKKMMVAE